MEINQELKDEKKTFLSHVFSTDDESKGEMINIVQYSFLAIIPVLVLNKIMNRFIPDADPDKSSIELLVEICIQLLIIFIGILLIHRMITFFPTYSGFKYENINLTGIILAFLVIVFSIQSKLGLKANILADRAYELYNGPYENFDNEQNSKQKNQNKVQNFTSHSSSRGDHLDNPALQDNTFPPAPAVNLPQQPVDTFEPMAANSALGGTW